MKYKEAVEAYTSSTWFLELASKTQNDYLYYLNYAGKLLPKTIKDVTPLLTDKIYLKVKNAKGERTALYVCSVMRRLWNYLYRMGHVPSVPWAQMGIKNNLKARTTIWDQADVEAVIDKAHSKGLLGLALFVSLAYDTAQRPSDILSLTWDNIKEDTALSIDQQKTGASVCVPFTDRSKGLLQERRDKLPDTKMVVSTKTGLKFHLTNLHKEFIMVRNELGLSQSLQLRDLRRTALTELGNAGATEDEIMAVSGHKSRQVVSVYVKKTDQQAMNAMNKRNMK